MTYSRLYSILKSPWFIAGLSLFLYLLITINRPMFVDEGLWNYISRIWLENGLPPYQASIENKTPGIFYLFALSHSLFGLNFMFVRILGILALTGSLFLIRRILLRLHSEQAAVIGMYIWGFAGTWDCFDGIFPSATESFMVFFVLLALWQIVRAPGMRNPLKAYLLAGICMGLAVTFKQVAVVAFAGLLLYVVLTESKFWRAGQLLRNCAIIVAIALVTHALTLLPLFFSDVSFGEYFEGAWLILLNSGTYNHPVEHLYKFFDVWFDSRFFVFLLIIPLSMLHYPLFRKPWFLAIALWLLLEIISVNIPGTYNFHQFRPALIAISLLLPVLLVKTVDSTKYSLWENKKALVLMLIGTILIMMPYKRIVINGYRQGFPTTVHDTGKWIKANTEPGDRVFAFAKGKGAVVLAYSERLSPSRHFTLIFAESGKSRTELLSDLYANPPRVIVVDKNQFNTWVYPDKAFLDLYEKVRTQGKLTVYFRTDKPLP